MIIIANWKMNGNFTLIQAFSDHLETSSHQVVLCPPFLLIDIAVKTSKNVFAVGGQDCHAFENGAYTGFTSPNLLKEIGCQYVILGHSERRHIESNQDIAAKAKAALAAGLIPVICVGESLEVREKGEQIPFVLTQVLESTKDLTGAYVIAYEPIWAIGTGKVCATSDIAAMHEEIKHAKPDVKVLYGGSVKASNAKEIATIEQVDGFLVGGASLDVGEFNNITKV